MSILINNGNNSVFGVPCLYNSYDESIETTALGLRSQAEVLAFISKWSGPYFVNTLTDFKEVLSDAILIVGVQYKNLYFL